VRSVTETTRSCYCRSTLTNINRSSLADVMHLAVGRGLRIIAGAAEVKFLTAGNVEFKAAVALKAVVFDGADRSPARALMKL
jgi:hypothetical protein